MDHRTFVDQVIKKVIEKTGMDEQNVYYQEADESMKEDAIIVIFGESETDFYCCRFFLEGMYGEYQSGCSVDDMADKIVEEVSCAKELKIKDKIEQLRDYEQAKKYLFVRLLNFDDNIDKLRNAIYRRVGDIALAVYFKISEEQGAMVSTIVEKRFLREWGKNEEEVFCEAMDNTMRMAPPRVYRLEKMILDPEGYEGEDFMGVNGNHIIHRGPLGNCISTTVRTNGAVAIFEKGVAQRLSDAMGGQDVYIVLTSSNEAMIHDVSRVHLEDLERILMETILEATPREDFLTTHIYKYSRKEDRITMLPSSREG